jgi:hypothetical protein
MVHEQAEEAYLITTGNISLPAQTWARGKPIQLVDNTQLLEWIKELGLSGKAVNYRLTGEDNGAT